MILSPTSQNKGEWSEFYAFLQLLSTNKIRVLDEDEEEASELAVARVIKDSVVFCEKDGRVLSLPSTPCSDNQKAVEVCTIATLKSCVTSLLAKMKKSSGTFAHEESERVASLMSVSVKSAASSTKGDLGVSFVRADTGIKSSIKKDLSVKSWLGSNPTLFNASKLGTKLIYRIEGVPDTFLEDLSKLGRRNLRGCLKKIKENGGQFVFEGCGSANMKKNLDALAATDDVSFLVLEHYSESTGADSLAALTSKHSADRPRITRAVAEFLRAAALGMTASKDWDCKTHAADNYLMVMRSGELFCVLGRGKLEEFLLSLAFIDTPSMSRHDFGYVYKKDGSWKIDLNFQIRLKPPKKYTQ